MEVGSKNIGILKYRPVLDDGFVPIADLEDLLVSAVKKVDLQVKGPSVHIIIEITEIWIVGCVLIVHFPAEMLSQAGGEGSLSGTNISGHSHVLYQCFVFLHYSWYTKRWYKVVK